jgi:hypothetical protein
MLEASFNDLPIDCVFDERSMPAKSQKLNLFDF